MSVNLTRYRELTYPPPFPDGWYRVAASGGIRPGEVKHVQCAGEQIALFRSKTDGGIAAVDAFCPHQGANLAHGRVKGDRLECPFHGWQLDGNGRIRDHPCAKDRPAVHRHWKAIDYYGMAMIYWSARRDAQAPYRLPPQPNIDNRQLVYRGQYDAGEVAMHIIEFAENSVDFQHFSKLHGTMRIPWTSIKLPWIRIRHEPSWSLDDKLEARFLFWRRGNAGDRGPALRKAQDPGGAHHLSWSWQHCEIRSSMCQKSATITMFQTHTPIEAL